MKNLKMIRFDIKNFFLKNKNRFFLPVIFSVMSYFILCIMVSDYQAVDRTAFQTWEQKDIKVTFLDWWYYVFAGLGYLDIGKKFEVPACWLAANLFLLFTVSGYLSFSMKGMGRLAVIKCNSEKRWWLTKGVINILAVFVYYALLMAPVLAITAVRGCISGLTPYVAESQALPLLVKEDAAAVVQIILLPVFVSLVLMFFMEFAEIYLGASLGFLLMAVLMIVSAYLSLRGLDGIFLMLRRMILFPEGRVSWKQVVCSGSVIIILAEVLGCKRCRRMDIGLEEDKQ